VSRFPLVSMVTINRARQFFFSQGKVPSGLISDTIVRSWERSASRNLPVDEQRRAPQRFAGENLAARQEKCRDLLRHSRPVMENLYEQIIHTSSLVLLTDAAGVVLHSIGDPGFVDRAGKVALKPGGVWDERVRGTNAIGTALVEEAPVVVHSAEHYMSSHHFLTCSASPIFDPQGRILGVLDVSTDSRAQQQHTMALVRISAQQIENQLFSSGFGQDLALHFHVRPEFVGTLYEGIAVFAEDGRLLAANRSALLHLGLDRYQAEEQSFSSLFDAPLQSLLEQPSSLVQPVRQLRTHSGMVVFCRLKSRLSGLPKGVILAPQSRESEEERLLESLELGDPTMRKNIAKVQKVLGHDIPVLIEGDSGTGKELFAQAMHRSGPRRDGPFVALNCAALPEGLIEAELFGYEEGAFTGAKRKGNMGKIRQADGGTLFLDEIGDMPLQLQARLLRILQERTVAPLGGSESHRVDFALVCATNRRIREEIAAGRFREDLYYRLNGLVIQLPPLRERADRLALAERIVAELAGPGRVVRLAHEVRELFRDHPWPGNIRQMHNVLRTAVALLGDGNEITREHLSDDFLEQCPTAAPSTEEPAFPAQTMPAERLYHLEMAAIRQAVTECGGNISAAARRLGISRNTLYRKWKKYGEMP
jgi:transcriptional regulator of acetoin/glycerol metabolism